MAVAQVYTAIANDVITAARWNNEFGNIYNNGTDIAFPLTKASSLAGFTLTLDALGVSTFTSSSSVGLTFTSGAKSGTPGVGANNGNTLNIVSATFTDTATAGSGTAAEFSAVSILTPTLAATNTLVTTTDAATLYIQAAPIAGTNETITNPWAIWVDSGAVRLDGAITANSSLHVGSLLFGKPISGLIQSNAAVDPTNDITISAGETVSDDATLASRRLMVLSAAITKQLDVNWVVGTDQGGLDTGAIANADYYIWLIQRADTGVVDALFSLSATAPTMPTNYAFKRLIGWIRRAGAAIALFTAYEYVGGSLLQLWTTLTLDIDLAATLTTTRRTDAVRVPTGVSVMSHLQVAIIDAAVSNAYIYSAEQADQNPSASVAPLVTIRNPVAGATIFSNINIWTVTGVIAAESSVATMDNYAVCTQGFTWSRK